MMALIKVALESLLSRKKTVILTFLSLTISIMVLFSVEHIRLQAKESFNRTISGVDLIVGAPSGQLNLLLYTVFRMGSPTNNIQYESFQMLQQHNQVSWAIPMSLGDSHKGFRVLGTNGAYFEHYRYGNKQALEFYKGQPFQSLFETVLGYDVAQSLNYQLGDEIVIAHGLGNTSFVNHDQAPFKVSGILARTGTPIDKTLHVSLPAIEAIHLPTNELNQLLASPTEFDLTPSSITGVMLGLNSKFATFGLQRNINNYAGDRLMAVMPGVALSELWSLMSSVENLLRVIAGLVLLSALFGLSTMLLASMNERSKEIAVFRVLGAGPRLILMLILLEALMLTVFAIFSAFVLVSLALWSLEGYLASEFGLFLSSNIVSQELILMSIYVLLATILVSIIPGIEAYKKGLNSRLSG